MRFAISTCIASLLTIAACSDIGPTLSIQHRGNYFTEFYRPQSGVTPETIAAARAAPPNSTPRVTYRQGYDESALAEFARQGYVLIGTSSFTSGYSESASDAIAQAVNVGADLVDVWAPSMQGTASASVPVTTPSTATSQTSGTATAFGSAGAVTAFGNATTTTYGTNTTYVPMTVNRYAYAAGYFVKWKYHLGANFRDLTDSERRQLQTNHGAYVTTVIDGTPAYDNDIVPGDIVLRINGEAVNGSAGATRLIQANYGRTVDLEMTRAGATVIKNVSILP